MRVAPHTEVRADRIAAYEAAHPECEDYARLLAELEKLPA